MLPMLERELVNKRQYTSMEEIMDYFAIGQCTPGVIAVNTATFIGFKRRGILGGIFATVGVVTPSVIIITLLASLLQLIAGNEIALHAFAGVSVAVSALMVQAVFKMGKTAVKDALTAGIALASFMCSFVFAVSPIVVIVVSCVAATSIKYLLDKIGAKTGGSK